jgi:hypothetical protein
MQSSGLSDHCNVLEIIADGSKPRVCSGVGMAIFFKAVSAKIRKVSVCHRSAPSAVNLKMSGKGNASPAEAKPRKVEAVTSQLQD